MPAFIVIHWLSHSPRQQVLRCSQLFHFRWIVNSEWQRQALTSFQLSWTVVVELRACICWYLWRIRTKESLKAALCIYIKEKLWNLIKYDNNEEGAKTRLWWMHVYSPTVFSFLISFFYFFWHSESQRWYRTNKTKSSTVTIVTDVTLIFIFLYIYSLLNLLIWAKRVVHTCAGVSLHKQNTP